MPTETATQRRPADAGVLNVLIASPLEQRHVDRIAAVDARIRVHYAPELLPRPRYVGDHVGIRPELSGDDERRWRELLADADVCFDFDWMETDKLVANAPRLRWVQATSAGIGGRLERTGLAGSDVVFTTAAGTHAVPLAEFALMSVLYFVKGVPFLRARQAEHRWERYTTSRLAGRRVVVVGLGGVGRAVVAAFAGLGVEVWGVGRAGRTYDLPGLSGTVSSPGIDTVLPTAYAVVLACPLTAQTTGLIGERQLRLLPRGAVIVNVSRGEVVDEAALTDALFDGHLGGAALDVFAVEPLPADSTLWDMENVIVSPHSASTVDGENDLLTDLFCANLRRWLDGAELLNRYEAARGY